MRYHLRVHTSIEMLREPDLRLLVLQVDTFPLLLAVRVSAAILSSSSISTGQHQIVVQLGQGSEDA